MSKSGYSRSGLFGTINHYDSHGHDTASYARVYQAVMTADKRRRSRSVETWMGFPRPSMKNLLRGPEAFQTLLLPDKYSMPYSFFFCKFCESFFRFCSPSREC